MGYSFQKQEKFLPKLWRFCRELKCLHQEAIFSLLTGEAHPNIMKFLWGAELSMSGSDV